MRLLQGVAQSPEAFCEDQSWSEPGAHLRILPERAMPVENSLHGAAEHPLRDSFRGIGSKNCHTRNSFKDPFNINSQIESAEEYPQHMTRITTTKK